MTKRGRVLWGLPLLLPLPAGLGGCVTGVQVADVDLVKRQVPSAQKVDATLGRFLAGMEKCGVGYGIAECSPPDAGAMVVCDVYLSAKIGGPPQRGDVMVGRMHFRPAAAGSEVTVGAQPWILRPDSFLSAWEKLVQGRAQEVCPKNFGG